MYLLEIVVFLPYCLLMYFLCSEICAAQGPAHFTVTILWQQGRHVLIQLQPGRPWKTVRP